MVLHSERTVVRWSACSRSSLVVDHGRFGSTGLRRWATMEAMPTPGLEGDALAAVRHRGGHLQIIAAAGSGKTEVVSQRAVDLMAGGVPPAGIVAFTFTE